MTPSCTIFLCEMLELWCNRLGITPDGGFINCSWSHLRSPSKRALHSAYSIDRQTLMLWSNKLKVYHTAKWCHPLLSYCLYMLYQLGFWYHPSHALALVVVDFLQLHVARDLEIGLEDGHSCSAIPPLQCYE